MNRRSFLRTSLLAAPAILTLTSLPALAGATGSTLIEAPGLSASGSFDILGFGAGGNGLVHMVFASGPQVNAQFGPNAVTRVMTASAGDRFAVQFNAQSAAKSPNVMPIMIAMPEPIGAARSGGRRRQDSR